MKIIKINLKNIFYSVDSLKSIFLLSILLVIPWSIFSEVLKFKQLVFYDSYNLRVFFSNLIFSFFIIVYIRSIILSIIGYYSFIFLPFVTYYFLRKGVLFSDLQDLDELMYALGNLSSYIIYLSIIIFFSLTILINIRFFKIKIFLLQIAFAVFIYFSIIFPQSFEKVFYPIKPNVEDFNVSAAFRNIGPIDAFFYHFINTLSFEKKLLTNKEIIQYDDFRSFKLNENIIKRNIHIILMESFIDPTDFKNIKITQNIIPNQWIEFKSKNLIYGISPVSGGGSAQAEFEILCGAPSILEYGTEFNRMGEGKTSCLPNYLRQFGYKTIASQPMHGSFFNIEKAYKSIGFDESYLTPSFDMSDMQNGWLSDRSFFKQHFEYLKKSLINDEPILNYLFAVGCHSVLGQKQFYEPLIEYSKSKNLEETLSCNARSIQHLSDYIKKIRNLDPNSLIFILSDHYPPGVSDYKDAGFACSTFSEYSCPKIRKMRIIFIGDDMQIDVEDRNFAYYELPEIVINHISDLKLCSSIKCSIDTNHINLNGTIVDRDNLIKIDDQSMSDNHKKLYQSLLRESLLNVH